MTEPAPRTYVLVRHVYGDAIKLVIATSEREVVAEITPRRALQLAAELLEAAQRELPPEPSRPDALSGARRAMIALDDAGRPGANFRLPRRGRGGAEQALARPAQPLATIRPMESNDG